VPATIAHPAAVIPLQKLGLPLSALIIGSLMPDFEFFLRISSERIIGHTFPGVFLFCLPIGLIFLFIFHYLLKKPLISLLPTTHQCRILHYFEEFRFFPLLQFLKITIALLIGIFSHLLLDSFTHENSFFTAHIPFLSFSFLMAPFGTVRIYFLLQQFFSIAGIVLMVIWYLNWCKCLPSGKKTFNVMDKKRKIIVLLLILFFTLITASIAGPMITFSQFNSAQTDFYLQLISHSAIAMVSGFLSALVVYSLSWHVFLSPEQKTAIHNDL
jgi:hypothetical protein